MSEKQKSKSFSFEEIEMLLLGTDDVAWFDDMTTLFEEVCNRRPDFWEWFVKRHPEYE